MYETNVNQTYTKDLNVSIVTRNGRIARVTTWQTGVEDSTVVTKNLPVKRLRKKGFIVK